MSSGVGARTARGRRDLQAIPLVHRLACVVFLVLVGDFAMVAAEDFGLNGDERREDSTAGTKREDMMVKRVRIVCDEAYARRWLSLQSF